MSETFKANAKALHPDFYIVPKLSIFNTKNKR